MSHWEKVESQITDLEVLKSACEELGCEVVLNGFARGWGQAQMKCPLVIKIPNGRYDVAVTKVEGGENYQMDADFYNGCVAKHLGKDGHKLGKVLEMYLVHQAEAGCKLKRKKSRRIVHDTHIDVVVTV